MQCLYLLWLLSDPMNICISHTYTKLTTKRIRGYIAVSLEWPFIVRWSSSPSTILVYNTNISSSRTLKCGQYQFLCVLKTFASQSNKL